MKIYNKLVRDKIPEIIKNNGGKAITRVLSEEEFLKYLLVKLEEETKELIEEPSAEELADIIEVVHAIADELNITVDDIEKVRLKKNKNNGSFKKRILLESTD